MFLPLIGLLGEFSGENLGECKLVVWGGIDLGRVDKEAKK